jgi:hypothetical protein
MDWVLQCGMYRLCAFRVPYRQLPYTGEEPEVLHVNQGYLNNHPPLQGDQVKSRVLVEYSLDEQELVYIPAPNLKIGIVTRVKN